MEHQQVADVRDRRAASPRLQEFFGRTGAQAIVSSLTGAAETKAAAAFLRTIALQSRHSEDFRDAPIAAVRSMTRLGEDGPAALRELHENGQVRNPDTRRFLKELSETGYHKRDPRHPPKRP